MNGPIPEGKARYDCECGNIHYGSAKASFISCPRCHATLKAPQRRPSTNGGNPGGRVDPRFYEDDEA